MVTCCDIFGVFAAVSNVFDYFTYFYAIIIAQPSYTSGYIAKNNNFVTLKKRKCPCETRKCPLPKKPGRDGVTCLKSNQESRFLDTMSNTTAASSTKPLTTR